VDGNNPPRLTWKRLGWLQNQRQTAPTVGAPRFYSVDGPDRYLIVWPIPSAALTARAQYLSVPPEPLDEQGEDDLDYLPVQWNQLLYDWTLLLDFPKTGRAGQVAVQQQLVKDGLQTMIMEEHVGLTEIETMPRFPGSADVFDDFAW
jgi:hypothetical protein